LLSYLFATLDVVCRACCLVCVDAPGWIDNETGEEKTAASGPSPASPSTASPQLVEIMMPPAGVALAAYQIACCTRCPAAFEAAAHALAAAVRAMDADMANLIPTPTINPGIRLVVDNASEAA
jgi:hypothetical protein